MAPAVKVCDQRRQLTTQARNYQSVGLIIKPWSDRLPAHRIGPRLAAARQDDGFTAPSWSPYRSAHAETRLTTEHQMERHPSALVDDLSQAAGAPPVYSSRC